MMAIGAFGAFAFLAGKLAASGLRAQGIVFVDGKFVQWFDSSNNASVLADTSVFFTGVWVVALAVVTVIAVRARAHRRLLLAVAGIVVIVCAIALFADIHSLLVQRPTLMVPDSPA